MTLILHTQRNRVPELENGHPDSVFFLLSLHASTVMVSHVIISVSFFLAYFMMLSAAQVIKPQIGLMNWKGCGKKHLWPDLM